MDFVILEVKQIQIYQNNLYRSNVAFSGVLRGTRAAMLKGV